MKVLQFTIPVAADQTLIVQEENLPHFYPHLHRHHEIQLTWIIKGEGTLVADNSMHNFSPNEIYCLGANQPHVFKSEASYFLTKNKKQCIALTIFFNPEGLLEPMLKLPELERIKKFITRFPSGFRVPKALVPKISALMEQIKKGNGSEKIIYLLKILHQLSLSKKTDPLCNDTKPLQYSEHAGLKMSGIYNYIIRNFEKPITLKEISRQANMTPQAFCRYFKKNTRLTFISFLNSMRINKACKKLAAGNYETIAGLAYECGFNSVSTFNRAFKAEKFISPKEFLDQYLNNTD